jgi:hypothetical protein
MLHCSVVTTRPVLSCHEQLACNQGTCEQDRTITLGDNTWQLQYMCHSSGHAESFTIQDGQATPNDGADQHVMKQKQHTMNGFELE